MLQCKFTVFGRQAFTPQGFSKGWNTADVLAASSDHRRCAKYNLGSTKVMSQSIKAFPKAEKQKKKTARKMFTFGCDWLKRPPLLLQGLAVLYALGAGTSFARWIILLRWVERQKTRHKSRQRTARKASPSPQVHSRCVRGS